MQQTLLRIRAIMSGIQEVILDVGALYSAKEELKRFDQRLSDFLSSHKLLPGIIRRSGDEVRYLTECIVPGEEDSRPPLLMVFGNPRQSRSLITVGSSEQALHWIPFDA